MSFNNRTAVTADYNDGYLRLNNENEFGNGVYTPERIRADSGFYWNSSQRIDDAGGDYGNAGLFGGGRRGWEGLAVENRAVFMFANQATGGQYNDNDNEWMFYAERNSHGYVYHNGDWKFRSQSDGLYVRGDVTVVSDRRLKENIKPLEGSLDKVLKMRGVSFEWQAQAEKESGEKIGFIAQEMLEVEPRVVKLNGAGPDTTTEYYGVTYENLTAHLVEAVKEQNAIINNLKERIETLENQHGPE